MHNVIEAIVRNPIKVAVGVLLVALFGLIAMANMPMQLTPEVQTPTITIETRWPGRNPDDVEREIVQEQEKQLKGVEGLVKMSSESMDSMGRITLEFGVGTDMREALLKANTRLQQVKEYPEDADEPVIKTANLSQRAIAWFILSPRPPSDEKIVSLERQHPELVPIIAKLKKTFNYGVSLLRLRELSKKHPALKELMPPEIEIAKLRKFSEDVIEARFERVDGISDSSVYGGRDEELQVLFDPQKLAKRQLTVMDLRNALRKQNKDTSAGDSYQGDRRYVIRVDGQYREDRAKILDPYHEISDTPIVVYEDGSRVYVRDVAVVRKGHKKPDGTVRRFGAERLAVNASRTSGANVLEVMEGLREATRELNDGVLKDKQLILRQVYDETEYIYSARGLVTQNGILGVCLTVIVLLVFLRSFRSTVVIFLAIPTSVVGTFLMLFLLGRSLNVISMAGLAFAVGMLVDNAVVVLENIYRHYQLGRPPFVAAVRGAREVLGAVVASTLTTLAVFIPVLFIQEEAGQLFRDIALAISCGIGLSLLVSMTVIPAATARLLRESNQSDVDRSLRDRNHASLRDRNHASLRDRNHASRSDAATSRDWLRPFTIIGNAIVDAVVGLNAWLQRSAARRLTVVVGFAGAAVFLSWMLMPKVEYLPTGNRNLVINILLPPPGYNLNKMIALGKSIEKELRPQWDQDKDSIKTADLKYPAIADYFYVVRGRSIFMGLRAQNANRVGELVQLMRENIGGKVPGTILVSRQSSLFERGLAAGRTIDVEITGPKLEKLIALGGEVLRAVKGIIPNCQALPKPSLDLASPEVKIDLKKIQAAKMKMSAEELGYTVDALIDGAYAGDFFVGSDKIDLSIIGKDPFPVAEKDPMLYRHIQDLKNLPIATKEADHPVPLDALANLTISSGPEQVNHRERQRVITIQVSPPPEVALEDAMDRIKTQIVGPMIEEGKLEGGLYQINLAGTADQLRATWLALRWNFVLAVLITYLLMAALFESWVYPLVIIVSVPLGAVGGFFGLWLLNQFILQPLDVLTMLGFVILIGTVVNNPILIVQQALIHMREENMPMQQAILESVRNRIRPIFMTTTTTIFGLFPLVLFPGAGSELYRGLGAVVLGGLLVSTLVTLIVVPSFFTLALQAFSYRKGDGAEEVQTETYDSEANRPQPKKQIEPSEV